MIRIEYNEDAFISCSIVLDHPGSKLHMYPDCCLCDLSFPLLKATCGSEVLGTASPPWFSS